MMMRTAVGVMLVAGLAQLVAAPVQAAPDPVKALRSALSPGKGVNVVSTAKTDHGRGVYYTLELNGLVAFGPRGVTASDTSQRLKYSRTAMSAAKSSAWRRTPPWKRRR
ncbi:hypothetical protein ABGB14_49310 [Nonomuraea sp. B10E15]|uniref:hypothetical protein n=1 Tax=Nonomuraea sp. B10E15 TaxID=3153560 RepID=UPI00325CD453